MVAYGDKERNLPDVAATQRELTALLEAIERHYGMKPIIYSFGKAYALYIANAFEGHDIWIRDVFRQPVLSDGRQWTFWQYSDRKVLPGYRADERYIDMNVFGGTQTQFDGYGR